MSKSIPSQEEQSKKTRRKKGAADVAATTATVANAAAAAVNDAAIAAKFVAKTADAVTVINIASTTATTVAEAAAIAATIVAEAAANAAETSGTTISEEAAAKAATLVAEAAAKAAAKAAATAAKAAVDTAIATATAVAETAEANERYSRNLIEASLDPLIVIDRNEKVSDVNRAAEKVTGYPRGRLIGMDFSAFFTEPQKARQTFHDVFSMGIVRNIPLSIKHKAGRLQEFLCSATIYKNGAGETEGVFAVARDVTELKKAEDALRKSEKRYREIVENVNDALIIHDFKGNIIDVNENASTLLGYSHKELLGANLKLIDSDESADLITGRMTRIIADGGAVFESIEVKKDGTNVPVEVSAKLISRKGAGLIQAFNRDITRRKLAEKEQARSYKKLKLTLEGTVNALSAVGEHRDPYTAGHQDRVTKLACAIAEEMRLSSDVCEDIRVAGKLHDIGKIEVPSEILSKPGKLSDLEFNIIKVHSQIGYDILKEAEFPRQVAEMVLQHHERINGSGYPLGLKADELLTGSKIMAVADVVEAITSHRPYRPALGIDVALDEIKQNSGILFDPEVVNACLTLFQQKGFGF